MPKIGKKLKYLEKAKEAEERATRARTPDDKKSWLQVAKAYRQLADFEK